MGWSDVSRGWIGTLVAVIFFFIFQIYLVKRANGSRGTNNKLELLDLIVTSEDISYRLSRFQIYICTVSVVIAFAAVAFYTGAFPKIPSNVAILMGINGLTTVLSTAIAKPQQITVRNSSPTFYKDIFLDKNGTLDLPRTQMFIWTIVILITHFFICWNGFYGGKPVIPDVDAGLLILMGVSNGAYLGVKAADQK